MKKVGELIQEAIETMEYGLTDIAFATACAALKTTLKKSLETEQLNNGDYYNFIKQHWQLLSFMSLSKALPMPLEINYKLRLILHGFNINGAEELVLHLVRQTAMMGVTPAELNFQSDLAFEVRNNQIFVPAALIYGLISLVIIQPANKDESVPDKFWINISDFKMFISEFWGRIDLAERIMDFYDN